MLIMDKTNIDVINGKGQGVQRHRGIMSFFEGLSALTKEHMLKHPRRIRRRYPRV
jgi:hypothetical protein